MSFNMGNSVSLSARGQSISLAPTITTSYTASPAVATRSSNFLDFGFTTKNSRSPASIQISTSLSSKNLLGTDNAPPCSANYYAEEGVGSLERRGAEGLEFTGESIQPGSVITPQQSTPEPAVKPEATIDSANAPSAEALEVKAPASEKSAVSQHGPPIPKPDDAQIGKSPPEPVAAPELQASVPQEKKSESEKQTILHPHQLDLKKQTSGDQSSLESPPEADEAEKEKTKPVDPVAKPPPAPQQPAQISPQAEGKATVKDPAPVQKNLLPGKAQTVPKPPAKDRPRIIYIPKKPIQLFGRPHVHHAEMR